MTRHKPSQPVQPSTQSTDSSIISAGRWLIETHLQRFDPPPTQRQIKHLVADPVALSEAVRRAYMPVEPTAMFGALPSYNSPSTRTRECLNLIDQEVRSMDLRGAHVNDIRSLILDRLGHSISQDGIRNMLRRNYAIHQLRYVKHRIQLRTDIIVGQLAQERREQQKSRKLILLHQRPRGEVA